jgi:hypothetical protein
MVNIYCSTLSEFVKPKRQANFKDFKRFGVFKGHVEQKNVVSIYNNSIARSNEILGWEGVGNPQLLCFF